MIMIIIINETFCRIMEEPYFIASTAAASSTTVTDGWLENLLPIFTSDTLSRRRADGYPLLVVTGHCFLSPSMESSSTSMHPSRGYVCACMCQRDFHYCLLHRRIAHFSVHDWQSSSTARTPQVKHSINRPAILYRKLLLG